MVAIDGAFMAAVIVARTSVQNATGIYYNAAVLPHGAKDPGCLAGNGADGGDDAGGCAGNGGEQGGGACGGGGGS